MFCILYECFPCDDVCHCLIWHSSKLGPLKLVHISWVAKGNCQADTVLKNGMTDAFLLFRVITNEEHF